MGESWIFGEYLGGDGRMLEFSIFRMFELSRGKTKSMGKKRVEAWRPSPVVV